MPDERHDRYQRIVEALSAEGAQAAKMFGMPSLKFGRKAFAGLYGDDMVFKLRGPDHARALALPGARLFDPSGMNRPMKEWVQVPAGSGEEWPSLGRSAMETARQDQ